MRTFNGKILVDIREFYQDDSGVQKPGIKGLYSPPPHLTLLQENFNDLCICSAGIALSLDQWEKLKDVIPEIDAKIHGQS